MTSSDRSDGASELHTLLNSLCQKLSLLPEPLKDPVEADIQRIKALLDSSAFATAETRYSELAESIDEGFVELDRDWRLTYINQRTANLLGISAEALAGKNIWQVLPELLGTPHETSLRKAMAERQPAIFKTVTPTTNQAFVIRAVPSKNGIMVFWIDITERNQVEEELRESETRYRILHTSMRDAFVQVNMQGQVVEYNDLYCQMLGYTPEEIRLLTYQDLTPTRWHEFEARIVRDQILARGYSDVYEKEYQRKDGSIFPVELRTILSRDAEGQPVAMWAIVRDISERVRGEIAIRESENRFRIMADGTPVIIWVTNAAGKIEFINRAYTDFFGVTLEQVQSGTWQMLVHPEDTQQYTDVFMQCLTEQKPFRAQARTQHVDGEWHWIDSHGQPRFSDDGMFLGLVGSSLDITERVEAEQALRESEERFRVALSALPITVYILDQDLRYTWIYNSRLGMDVQQILGKRDDEMLSPEVSREIMAVKQAVIDTGQSALKEITVHVDGSSKISLLSLEPIFNAVGTIIGLIGASLDITEQRQIERERQYALTQMEIQRQLLDNREKERQEIAHDLHDGPIQLLSGTLFNLQMTKEIVQDRSLTLEIDQAMLNLKATIRELREIVNELRPPSVIRFGFYKATAMHVEDFQDKHPEIKVDLQGFEDGSLLSETVRLALFRIYQESLNNIVKHASASQVVVRFYLEDRHAHLQIQDNGQGFLVPADFLEQAQRGHYGLTGMKERAEAVGGILQVLSAPGNGAIIKVSVPLSHLPNQPA